MSARTAIAKYQTGWLTQQKLILSQLCTYKFKIKMLAGLVSPETFWLACSHSLAVTSYRLFSVRALPW